MTLRSVRLLSCVVLLAGCPGAGPPLPPAEAGPAAAPTVDPEHRAEVEAWVARRDEALRADTGWLTLAGLFWLEEGEQRFGSDPGNEIVFPDAAPALAGTFTTSGSTVTVSPAPGVELLVDGEAIGSRELTSDAEGEPTLVDLGSLQLQLIDREGRLAIRLKDRESDVLANFHGIERFPIDSSWRLEARFEAHEPGRTMPVPNVIGGDFQEENPGAVVFEVDGATHRLETMGTESGRLFIVFGDETNGRETYGGGRFVYADPPDDQGRVVVDFNQSYNPPCVFTPWATCPLPPPGNRLPLRIEAGEKLWGAPH